MKAGVILGGLGVVILAIVAGGRLSSDAIGLVVGAVLGMAAMGVVAILMIWTLQRDERRERELRQWERERGRQERAELPAPTVNVFVGYRPGQWDELPAGPRVPALPAGGRRHEVSD